MPGPAMKGLAPAPAAPAPAPAAPALTPEAADAPVAPDAAAVFPLTR